MDAQTLPDPMDLIRAERLRQVEKEGYDAAHDDAHDGSEIMAAAMCYLAHVRGHATYRNGIPASWPWEDHFWKPKDAARDLVRSGALMLAEQERRQRAGLEHGHVDQKLAIVAAELRARLAA